MEEKLHHQALVSNRACGHLQRKPAAELVERQIGPIDGHWRIVRAQNDDFATLRNQSSTRQTQKQAVFDDAGNLFEPRRQTGGVLNEAKIAIKEIILLIRKRYPLRLQVIGPQHSLTSEFRNLAHDPRRHALRHLSRDATAATPDS